MKLWIGAAVAAIAVAPAYAGVTYNYEAAGKKTTTATFDYSGVETFDMRSLGNGQTFSTDFGTTGDPVVITGTYKGVDVYDADQYGGDDGSNYAVTFSSGGFLLELSTSDDSPLTYFGYWLSALDRGNQLEFLKDGSVVATITPADVIARTGACPASPYCGMPDGPFAGQNKNEPYAFINVYFDGGDSYDAVRFFESPQVGGYESDNHTVGYFVAKGGVPEPATWAMLITGFGLVGAAARRRRSAVVTA